MIILYIPTEFEQPIVRFVNNDGKIGSLPRYLATYFRQSSASIWMVPGTMEDVV